VTRDDDAQLIAALRAGDAAAFATLVDRHSAAMIRVARAYVPSRAVAEEVVQEAWIAAAPARSAHAAGLAGNRCAHPGHQQPRRPDPRDFRALHCCLRTRDLVRGPHPRRAGSRRGDRRTLALVATLAVFSAAFLLVPLGAAALTLGLRRAGRRATRAIV
jgi:hypothetical protein